MKIEYLGHSSFKLTSNTGASVVCDPYESSVGFSMPEVSANAVTVSHHHYDHDCVGNVGGNPEIIEDGSADVGGIRITAIPSFHDEVRGKKRGANNVFKFAIDGITVCHLGDLGEPFTEERAKAFLPVDVLLIPVGGTYTIDAATAAKYAGFLAPSVIIPMHYRTERSVLDIEPVDGFLKLFDGKIISIMGSNAVELEKADMNGSTKIFVLRSA